MPGPSRLLPVLLIAAAIAPLYGAEGEEMKATAREEVAVTMEMDFPTHEVQQGDYESPVATFNGSIYAVWVDDELRTMIARKSPDGTVETNVLFEQTIEDRYHVAPSIGIDRAGYIHVTGNMHNSPDHLSDFVPIKSAWQYVVSDRPEDVSSFTFRGDDPDRSPPGTAITYPFFAADNGGELYLAFRHRVKYGVGWSPGIMAGGVARYDVESKRWDMLGGTDYVHGVKTLFWTAKPGGGDAYQGFKVRVFFDRDNRMHLTSVMHAQGTSSLATHVVYACSDDGGATFKRADGSRHDALPITLQNADIVVGPPWVEGNTLYNKSEVGVTTDGHPMVAFNKREERAGPYVCYWRPESGWSEPTRSHSLSFCTDPDGVITVPVGDSLQRSSDKGGTWQAYRTETSWCLFDFGHLARTGQVRYRALQDGRFQVWTAVFD